MQDPPRPLTGLKVLEMARILAGPWLGQMLADMGADVVKLEAPAGDETRRWGPPFITHAGETNAAYFHCCNRGKRSLIADIKTPQGAKLARALAAKADIIIENHKAGALRPYRLHYAAVREKNPGVIYCSISGFGQSGPRAHQPGYDFIAQGMGGIMSVTGEADGAPQKTGVAIADLFTALYGGAGVLAALLERGRTGAGRHIDVALLDSIVGIMANQALNYLAAGESPSRRGNVHPNIAPYQLVAAADGHIILAVGSDAQFRALCALLDAPALADDARFADNAARVRNQPALSALLAERLCAWKKAAFLSAAERAGIPAGPINTLAEVFADAQVRHRRMQIGGAPPAGGGSDKSGAPPPGVRLPVLYSGEAMRAPLPPPRLGAHTDEVTRDWLAAAADDA